MKYPTLLTGAACLFLVACSHQPRHVSVVSSRPAATVNPGTVLVPTKDLEVPTPELPIRRGKAYTPVTLPKRLQLSPEEITLIKNDIRAWLKYPENTQGDVIRLYDRGVTTLDHWLDYGPHPQDYPPDAPSYYELIYRDGRPVVSYRHDSEGRRLAQRIFYSRNRIPVGSVSYGPDDKPRYFAHLTYDTEGRIKEIVTLNERGEPFFGVCLAITGVYERTERINYSLMRGHGYPSSHTITGNSVVYRLEADGTKKQVNRGSELWRLTCLAKFGVKPFYPLPDGFHIPRFDRYGAPVAKAE